MQNNNSDWKLDIRKDIIDAAKVYSNLAGKTYLYIYGDKYFELLFKNTSFMHLTGVESNLKASDFYKMAKAGILTVDQFYFTNMHPFTTAKRKVTNLKRLPELTTQLVAIVENFHTDSSTYKIGATNLDFTIGLIESDTRKDWYIPKSLRVRDKSIENSNNGDFASIIMCKNATASKYSQILFKEDDAVIPKSISLMISETQKFDKFL